MLTDREKRLITLWLFEKGNANEILKELNQPLAVTALAVNRKTIEDIALEEVFNADEKVEIVNLWDKFA